MSFLPLPADRLIIANGVYVIGSLIPGSAAVVEWDGALGTATVTVGRATLGGTFAAYKGDDGNPLLLASDADLWVVTLTARGTVLLQVTGATTGTSIESRVTRCADQ